MSAPLPPTPTLRPITLREARRFVADHHRHNIAPRGWRFGVGLTNGVGSDLVGVAIASRPVARGLDDGVTIEVIRCTVIDGQQNACSMLYGALCRAAKALGYRTAYTYTLDSEPGTSLRAAGFTIDAELDERPAWGYTGQGRYQQDLFGLERHNPGPKVRWRREL